MKAAAFMAIIMVIFVVAALLLPAYSGYFVFFALAMGVVAAFVAFCFDTRGG